MTVAASNRIRVVLCAVAGAALTACSSSTPAELTTSPTVAANGKHYTYAAGSVAQSGWPRVCSLLTTRSAAAAIGAAVSTKAFHHRCFYLPANAAFPTLTVTILGIGSNQRGTYEQVRAAHARYQPVRVAGVGSAAIRYDLTASPTAVLDLLARQGLFEIALRSPVGNVTGKTDAQGILTRVGKALAKEFGS